MFGEESLSGTGELETARRVGGVPGPVGLLFVAGGEGVGFSEGVVDTVVNGIAVGDEFEFVQDRREKDRRWPKAQFIQSVENLAQYESSLFDDDHTVPMHLIGSPFYVKVWKALLEIPMGHASTYSAVALRAGNVRAVRAVGTAIGKNPISWLIPCHRVLRKDGSLGGYHWGLSIKRAMLAYEAFKTRT